MLHSLLLATLGLMMLGFIYISFVGFFSFCRWLIVDIFGTLIGRYIRLMRWLGWRGALPITLLIAGFGCYGLLLLGGQIDYLPGNTYAEGWRMGQLTHFAMDGNPLVQTGEAELMHGKNSSAGEVRNANSKVIFRNPGYLSSTQAVHDAYRSLVGQYVAIRYRRVKVQLTTMNGNTDYRIMEIVPVDPAKTPPACGVTEGSSGRGDGDDVGYLVKVSSVGNGFSSYEVVIQRGDASGTFEALSISDWKIYDCAVSFLRAGVQVKIHYTHSLLRDPLRADTTLDIVGISPVANPQ